MGADQEIRDHQHRAVTEGPPADLPRLSMASAARYRFGRCDRPQRVFASVELMSTRVWRPTNLFWISLSSLAGRALPRSPARRHHRL